MEERAKHYKRLYDEAKAVRSDEEKLWQEAYDFCLSRPVDVTSGLKKSKNTKAVSAGVLLTNQLTTHLSGTLTPPTTRWFRLGVLESTLMKNKRVTDWLDACSDIITHHINQSNFSSEIKKAYRELVVTGNVGFSIEEGEGQNDDLFNFSARGVYEYVTIENQYGKVQTLIRSPRETGRWILNKWGSELPDEVLKKCEAEPTKRFRLLHVIEPRKIYDAEKIDKKNKPIMSLWIFYDTDDELEESGFDDMPVPTGRINKDTSSEYGVGFGVQALRELNTLNSVRIDTLKAKRLMVDPPLLIPDGTLMSPGSIAPGQNILYRPMQGRSRPEPLLTGAQPQFGDQEAQNAYETLKEIFFADALNIIDTKYETREGVMQRADTQTRLLAGTASDLQNDLFEPIVMRCFFIAARRGILPPMPQELAGKAFRPVWLSPLALRSKEATVDPLVRSVQQVSGVVQMLAADVEGLDTINKDAVIRRIWDANGAPGDCLYDVDTVNAKREERKQMMQQQMMSEQAMQGINSMADAEAKTANTDGVVGNLMKSMGKAVKNGK